MRKRIEPEQTAILEKAQERTQRIRELVGHLVTLTNKLRRANGLNKRTLAEEIRVVGSALKKLGGSQTRRRGTPARSTMKYTLGKR